MNTIGYKPCASIQKIEYKKFSRKFKKPFLTAGTPLLLREGVYLKTSFLDGTFTIGEAAPLPGFSKEDFSALDDFLQKTNQKEFVENYKNNTLLASLQMAMDTCLLQPGGVIDPLFVNAVFDVDAQLEEVLQKIENGFQTLKFKISPQNFPHTEKILLHIRKNFPNDIALRLDANSSFTYEEALAAVKKIEKLQIQYIEDFLRSNDSSQYGRLRDCAHVSFCVDMPINREADLQEQLEKNYFDYFLIKPSVYGGLKSTSKAICTIQEHKKNVILGSSFETEIGLTSLINFSLQISRKINAFGFSTANYLEGSNFLNKPVYNEMIVAADYWRVVGEEKNWKKI